MIRDSGAGGDICLDQVGILSGGVDVYAVLPWDTNAGLCLHTHVILSSYSKLSLHRFRFFQTKTFHSVRTNNIFRFANLEEAGVHLIPFLSYLYSLLDVKDWTLHIVIHDLHFVHSVKCSLPVFR
jgi:hypothetical protein